jgi:hypothetical protein
MRSASSCSRDAQARLEPGLATTLPQGKCMLSPRGIVLTAAVVATALVGGLQAPAQAEGTGAKFFTTFLQRAPGEDELRLLPASARNVVVARVHVAGGPAYLIGRDQSGRPPALPKDLYWARLEVVEVIRGDARPGEQHDVFYGMPGTGSRYSRPFATERGIHVVSYVSGDGVRRLLAFPVSEEEFGPY